MPVTPERITRLRGFGLSEYAARAYLALLHLGMSEARDISTLSKVPASKIYHVLDHLGEKGLVTVLPEFPRKYAPVPFSDFLERLLAEHESAARGIRDGLPELVSTFALDPEPTAATDRGSVTLLRGRRNVHERALEMLANARDDALVLLTAPQAEGAWSDPVGAARARGLRIHLLADAPPSSFVLVADGRRALLAHVHPDDGHPTEGNDTGLLLEQEGLVALVVALLGSRRAAPPERAIEVAVEGSR